MTQLHHASKGPQGRVRKPRTRRRVPPGMSPGTLLSHPEAPRPVIQVLAFGPEDTAEQILDEPWQVQNFLDRWPVVWIRVVGLGDAEIIRTFGELFALHRLALEDILDLHQRPKAEEYRQYLFMVAEIPRLGERFETNQFSLFLGPGFVLSFEEQAEACLAPVCDRIRAKRGRVRDSGADYLAYALLDAIVDSYFPLLEEYGERLETLENEVINRPRAAEVTEIHEVKRNLLRMRRAMWPQRDALSVLLRDTTPLISAETRVHLRDCYDHTVQIIDLLETHRELGADLMDMYLSSISNHSNEIMRVLTVITVIFIPLTFIVGLYGMNFNTQTSPWNMPELGWYWGYPAVVLLMAAMAVGQILFFQRRGWLGAPRELGSKEKNEKEGVGK